MSGEINSIAIFRLLKKWRYLFTFLFVGGVVVILLFFIFNYPHQAASVRIHSEDLGDVFPIDNVENGFLSKDYYNRLIHPVIEAKQIEKKEYKIRIIDTLVKGKINQSTLRKFDLVISRNFNKREQNVKDKFMDDLEDFFTKFERALFSWFLYQLKYREAELSERKFILEKSIQEENEKIEVVKNFVGVNVEKYHDVLDKSSFFLPPDQQYNGLVIERDMTILNLGKVERELGEINSTLDMIREGKVQLFSKLLQKKELRNYPTVYHTVMTTEKKLTILQEYYNRISFSNGNSLLIFYVLICSLIFLLIVSFMVVCTAEWWKKNRSKI